MHTISDLWAFERHGVPSLLQTNCKVLHLQDQDTLIEQSGSEIGKSTVQLIINNHASELGDGLIAN